MNGERIWQKPANQDNMKVKDIILEEGSRWDTTKIVNMFPKEIACVIHVVPILSHLQEDTCVWPYTKDGNFTVKSGYFLHSNDRFLVVGVLSSSSSIPLTFWNLDIDPKVKTFAWRLCHRAFAYWLQPC